MSVRVGVLVFNGILLPTKKKPREVTTIKSLFHCTVYYVGCMLTTFIILFETYLVMVHFFITLEVPICSLRNV